jgi:UV DNA damage endonuclease
VSDREALALALGTWPTDVTPKIHYSSPRSDKFRAHADLVDANDFERLMREVGGERDFDVMLEAKAKDVALLTLRAELSDAGLESRDGRLMVSA